MDYSSYTDLDLMALTIYREARGEGELGRRGVGWVIYNRSQEPCWWGKNIRSVILKPSQFSSFNADDPNSNLIPNGFDRTWLACRLIANSIINGHDTDITEGANYYHSLPVTEEDPFPFPARWGPREDYKMTLHVGRLWFYRFSPILAHPASSIDEADIG